ncbi:bactericidal permeability-increasing protein-like [Rhineura floridana]|uniref:bactericidal permeability-increasing protein-like n=1 Tax=Rhineura floridana TaxID=261503 RepID=UPI002AC842AB|nr:bactericidal permeability-increasing protein-like [Rhineura floridana]
MGLPSSPLHPYSNPARLHRAQQALGTGESKEGNICLLFQTSKRAQMTWTPSQTLGPQRMFFWIISMALLMQTARGAEGGLKVQVSQKGLEYAKELGLELLKSRLKKETFQDINGSSNVPLVGKVQYSVSGARVSQLQVNHIAIGFIAGTGVNISIQNAQFLVSGNWKMASVFRQDSGTADISINRLSLSAVLGVGRDAVGRPQVWYDSCRSAIGDFSMKFSGGSSWLYNLAASVLKKMLKSEVNKHLCSELKKEIDKVAQLLKTMDASAQLDAIAGIDYSLVNKPVIDVDRCNVDLKGQFFVLGEPHRKPFLPAPFLLPNQSDSMILLGISESVANSAAFVYYTAGALRMNYKDSMVPRSFPFRLNTKNVGLFLPELKKRFPDMPMEIHLSARKQPLLTFQPSGVEATLFGSAEAFVVLPNASLASVFRINIDSKLTGQFFLKPDKSGKPLGKVGGSVALKNFHLSQDRPKIGEIKCVYSQRDAELGFEMYRIRLWVTGLEELLHVAGRLAVSRFNRAADAIACLLIAAKDAVMVAMMKKGMFSGNNRR